MGSRILFGRHITLSVPGGYLAIGDDTYVSDRCVFEISANPRATVQIGNNCFLAHDVHLGAYGAIKIGSNVRIAEYTSLRDTSHRYKNRNRKVNEQGDDVGTITIGDDVWIGKGCLVQGSPEGIMIGNGAVIGAHAVVKDSIQQFAIAVGIPARVIGYRQ